MGDVSLMLLVVAGIFIIGSAGEIVFARTHVPDVLWLIVCGWLLGPVSGFLHEAVLLQIAPYFAAVALIVILFDGGTSLKLGSVAQAAPRAAVLAVTGFCLSAAVVAALSMLGRWLGVLPRGWSWLDGVLLGAILGGSSSIIILPAMTTSRTQRKVADILCLESTFTDALCVVTASALVTLLLRRHGASGWSAVATLGQSFGVAVVIGVVAGTLWLFVLHLLRDREHAYPITLASLLLLYVLINSLGASAAMGVLTFAVIVGNARLFGPKLGLAADIDLGANVRGFHAQMAFIIKSFFFVLIGALLGPPWPLVAVGVVLGLILLPVRVPAVQAATYGNGFDRHERAVMATALPRGLAAGVMATIPAAAGVPHTQGLVTVVFACIVTTIVVFSIGMPLIARWVPPAVPGPGSAEPVEEVAAAGASEVAGAFEVAGVSPAGVQPAGTADATGREETPIQGSPPL